ncbi:MAG TPA: hypothetical protein VFX76_08710 [Roseiflexaceae bacterium]|nr:hypothetical protein [Roseiflexaceae bacterium]
MDHNEAGQALLRLEEAAIIAVLDHHWLGNLPTPTPIRFRVDPVGSSSTLVVEEALEANLTSPPGFHGQWCTACRQQNDPGCLWLAYPAR